MGTLKTTNIQTITGSGTLTLGTSGETLALGSGVTSNLLYPAFEAKLSADQAVSDATTTKVQFDSEVLDTDNCYDNTTNYRFTPNVAGKYYVFTTITGFDAGNDLIRSDARIYKNGSNTVQSLIYTNNSTGSNYFSPSAFGIIDMNGTTDYLEAFTYVDYVGSSGALDGGGAMLTHFGAYRIGT